MLVHRLRRWPNIKITSVQLRVIFQCRYQISNVGFQRHRQWPNIKTTSGQHHIKQHYSSQNEVLMLDQRLRRLTNIKTTLDQRLV